MKLFHLIGNGAHSESPEVNSLLESYLLSSGPKPHNLLEEFFSSSLSAFQVKDRHDDAFTQFAGTLATLLVSAEALLSQAKRGSPSKSNKSPASSPRGKRGSQDQTEVVASLEDLCNEAIRETKGSKSEDLSEFTHPELEMKKFYDAILLNLVIGHLFATGNLSNHILFSDW